MFSVEHNVCVLLQKQWKPAQHAEQGAHTVRPVALRGWRGGFRRRPGPRRTPRAGLRLATGGPESRGTPEPLVQRAPRLRAPVRRGRGALSGQDAPAAGGKSPIIYLINYCESIAMINCTLFILFIYLLNAQTRHYTILT